MSNKPLVVAAIAMIGVSVFVRKTFDDCLKLKQPYHNDSNAIMVDLENLPEPLKTKHFLYQEVINNGLSYNDYLVLKRIAEAESGFNHYDKNGDVLRGKLNKSDIGIFQINEYYHLKKSQELEFDIYNKEDNIKYAIYLYKKNGTKDWSWSKKIWSR